MKIRSVSFNNKKKAFAVRTSATTLSFPYAKLAPAPNAGDPVVRVAVDEELGREGFTYYLRSGEEGSVHIDQVLEYNQDPRYLRDLLLYQLTVEARARVEMSALSKREIIRRLGTSDAQFYRLLDQTNYRKSVDPLLSLLQVLDCEVEVRVRTKPSSRTRAA
jgi:predicted XRE-type DNA-binding protein